MIGLERKLKDIQNVGGHECLSTRHSTLKEWIKVSIRIIPTLIVVPSKGTFIRRGKVFSSFGQGLMGQGWGAGQELNGLCAGLM